MQTLRASMMLQWLGLVAFSRGAAHLPAVMLDAGFWCGWNLAYGNLERKASR